MRQFPACESGRVLPLHWGVPSLPVERKPGEPEITMTQLNDQALHRMLRLQNLRRTPRQKFSESRWQRVALRLWETLEEREQVKSLLFIQLSIPFCCSIESIQAS